MLHFRHQDVFIFRAHPYLLTVLRNTSEGKKNNKTKQNRKYKNKQKEILMSKNFS